MKMMAGSVARRFLEDFAEPRLALPVELAHDFGSVEVDEMDPALGRNRTGQERLARAGRPVEQHALGRQDAQALEHAGRS